MTVRPCAKCGTPITYTAPIRTEVGECRNPACNRYLITGDVEYLEQLTDEAADAIQAAFAAYKDKECA